MRLYFSLILGLFAALLSSCVDDLDTNKIAKPTLKPSVEIPVAYSTFTFSQFLEKGESTGTIQQQGNDLVLIYQKQIFSQDAESFFNIPDQSAPTEVFHGIDFPFADPGATFTISKNENLTITTSGEKLDSLIIKAGKVHIEVNSDFQASIDLSIGFPSVLKDGLPVQTTLSYVYPGSGPGDWVSSEDLPLDDAHIDLTKGGTTYNKLPYSITISVTDKGAVLSAANSINVNVTIGDISFKALFGDLGSKNFASVPDTINMDILDNAFAGTFQPVGAKLSLIFKNEFGAAVAVDLGSLGGISTSGSVEMLSGPALSPPANPHNIEGPDLSMVGQPVSSSIELTAQNSNFLDILNDFPYLLFYKFEGTLNPVATTDKNFAIDTSKVTIDFRAEVPLSGVIKGFAIRKKFAFDGINLDELKDLIINQHTINSFPIDLLAQAYFLDENETVTDSLYLNDRTLIKSAPVDADGSSTGETTLDRDVSLTETQIDHIRDSKFLLLVVVINGSASGNLVNIQSDDRLTIQLGIKGSVEYTL